MQTTKRHEFPAGTFDIPFCDLMIGLTQNSNRGLGGFCNLFDKAALALHNVAERLIFIIWGGAIV